MKLHYDKDSFESLSIVTANYIGIPVLAVRKDYFIVMLLQNLQNSEFADLSVFKGGTSLSKCYPNSIDRFSEDIDLTYIPNDRMSENQYSKNLKQMEAVMIGNLLYEKIESERNNRNKSTFVWFDQEDKESDKIKIEIGSSIKPEPYTKRKLKTYIQEYLENRNMGDVILEFELEEVEINVLNIERTFIDKIFAVKRHAVCGSLTGKVRHIYDVTKLFEMQEIQSFLTDKKALKEIVSKTKNTDSYYLEKRMINQKYDATGLFDFDSWKVNFNERVKIPYELLHETLLYHSKKQNFSEAIEVFEKINNLLIEIEE